MASRRDVMLAWMLLRRLRAPASSFSLAVRAVRSASVVPVASKYAFSSVAQAAMVRAHSSSACVAASTSAKSFAHSPWMSGQGKEAGATACSHSSRCFRMLLRMRPMDAARADKVSRRCVAFSSAVFWRA